MTHNYEFYIASQYNSNIIYDSNIIILLIIITQVTRTHTYIYTRTATAREKIIIESTDSTHWLYHTLRNHMMLHIIIV